MKTIHLTAAAAAVILLILLTAQAAVPTGSWGLSFSEPGLPPAGPMSPERLRQLGAADRGEGMVLYLTFDAGYENGYTPAILDTLKKHGVPAAFFLVGDYLERNADLVRRMAKEGHTVGNHTLTHPDMTGLSEEEFRRELQGCEDLYRELTGQELPKFFRPPQGLYSEETLKQAQNLGYKTVFWSLAHADWDNGKQPDPDKALELLTSRTHPGAVVLLHTNSETNAAILDRLITRWKGMGYRFGTLEELFETRKNA